MAMQRAGEFQASGHSLQLTKYGFPNIPGRLLILGKGLPCQMFNIVLPTGVSYADSLPIYRYVAQLERPPTDKPIIVRSLTRKSEREPAEEFPFPLDAGYDTIRQEVPGQLIAVGIRYWDKALNKGKEFWRCVDNPSVEYPAWFSFLSTEMQLPPYLVDVALRFAPESPRAELESDFRLFEHELS